MKIEIIAFASLLLAGQTFADEPARVIGPIADGSPSSQPLFPAKLDVQPQDVISSKVADMGNRKITVQKIQPFDLPATSEPVVRPEFTEQRKAAFLARQQSISERVVLMISVNVFRSESYPGKVRTQFRWWSEDRSREFEAWSNVDGNWLSGFGEFISGGSRYCLILGISSQDVDKCTESMARQGRAFQGPDIPVISGTGPSFVVTKGNPSQEELAPIQAIHNLVKNEGERLRVACEGRTQAQKDREEYLRMNPPKPTDIVLNYWRIPKSDSPAPQEGGQQ